VASSLISTNLQVINGSIRCRSTNYITSVEEMQIEHTASFFVFDVLDVLAVV